MATKKPKMWTKEGMSIDGMIAALDQFTVASYCTDGFIGVDLNDAEKVETLRGLFAALDMEGCLDQLSEALNNAAELEGADAE